MATIVHTVTGEDAVNDVTPGTPRPWEPSRHGPREPISLSVDPQAHTDGALRDAFTRVLPMERPPTSLFRPGVVWRVLWPTRA